MQMAADGPAAFDGHHGVNVRNAIHDLSGGGHLGGQLVVGDDILRRVAGGHGRQGEAVHGSDQGHDRGVGDALFPGRLLDGAEQFAVADFDHVHGFSPFSREQKVRTFSVTGTAPGSGLLEAALPRGRAATRRTSGHGVSRVQHLRGELVGVPAIAGDHGA
jgi:hypothetical protein